MKLNNKGFTLVEVIITIALSSIIILVLGNFLINSINNYNRINDNNELYDQAQFLSYFLDERIAESDGIVLVVSDKNFDATSTNSSISLKEIVFSYNHDEFKENSSFQIKNENDIFYNNHSELGNYIDKIFISPVPSFKSYKDCNALKYKIYLSKGKSDYVIERVVYMRNKY